VGKLAGAKRGSVVKSAVKPVGEARNNWDLYLRNGLIKRRG
jgi:hypothetical protein